jgi:hypothetical protein
MSRDLWAAFGTDSNTLSHNPWASSEETTTTQKASAGSLIDFGLPPSHSNVIDSIHTRKRSVENVLWDAENYVPENKLVELNEWSDSRAQSTFTTWPSAPPEPQRSSPINVLDDQWNEEDDFGDFEAPQLASPELSRLSIREDVSLSQSHANQSTRKTNSAAEPKQPTRGLDAIKAAPRSQTPSSAPKTDPRPEHRRSQSAMLDRTERTKVVKAPVQRPAPLIAELEVETPYTVEEWGEFSPDPKSATVSMDSKVVNQPQKPPTAGPPRPSSRTSNPNHSPSRPSKPKAKLPPTNVPPPSILIALSATLVERLPSQIDTVLSQQALQPSSPAALAKALNLCLASLRVSARIVAGRKLRWKRDTHLAQSMAIGPAGKTGGMKLTGVDKAEQTRENREAQEFVRVWKGELGRNRAALAKVNAQTGKEARPLVLPDITSEVMLVRALKEEQGGVSGSKCCFLCGLRREERVEKLDVDVWDNLGEWWEENWGHAECRMYWENHEKYLTRR